MQKESGSRRGLDIPADVLSALNPGLRTDFLPDLTGTSRVFMDCGNFYVRVETDDSKIPKDVMDFF
jgi:hypothetical protein